MSGRTGNVASLDRYLNPWRQLRVDKGFYDGLGLVLHEVIVLHTVDAQLGGDTRIIAHLPVPETPATMSPTGGTG